MKTQDQNPSGRTDCSTFRHMQEVEQTHRGFDVIHFDDGNGERCSVQCSSAIDDTEQGLNQPGSSFLWIGPDDANPKIMASKAAMHGVKTTATTGWVPYPVPDEVLMNTRMHLHREHVQELVQVLNRWLESGTLDT